MAKWSVAEREVFPSSNIWGIPDLLSQDIVLPERTAIGVAESGPGALVLDRTLQPRPGSTIGFFLEDYRIEPLWNWPTRGLARLLRMQPAAVIEPAFSLHAEMPTVVQLWNLYRSRWLGRWWQAQGLTVIPALSWQRDTLDAITAGIPEGSVIACTARPGCRDRGLLIEGLSRAITQIRPRAVLLYGADAKLPDELPDGHYIRLPAWSPKKRMLYSPAVAQWMDADTPVR